MRERLNPDGQFVIDVAGIASLARKEELTEIEERLLDGFWADGDYVGIKRSFVYPDKDLSLDRYLIVEPKESWQIFDWFQHFTPESIEAELQNAGFEIDQMVGE